MSETFTLSKRAIARRKERDRRDGLRHLTHEKGLCGAAVAACCPACYHDEVEEMKTWALTRPDPEPDEAAGAYWHRIDGAFLDGWYEVACWRIAGRAGR